MQLPDIDHLDRVLGQQALELVHLDRRQRLGLRPVEHIAAQLAETDGAQAPARVLGLLAGSRQDQRALVLEKDKGSPGRETLALERNVDRAERMACSEELRRADVEDRWLERASLLERLRRAEEGTAVQLDDPLEVRRPRRARQRRFAHELVLAANGQHRVEPALEADRRRGLGAHRSTAERARDVAGEDLDPVWQL